MHSLSRIQRVENEPGSPPPTILIQQAIQHLTEFNAYFDTNVGTFGEAEIVLMQGLMSKTLLLRASRQVQSALPFPHNACLMQSDAFWENVWVVSHSLRITENSGFLETAVFCKVFVSLDIRFPGNWGECVNLSSLYSRSRWVLAKEFMSQAICPNYWVIAAWGMQDPPIHRPIHSWNFL